MIDRIGAVAFAAVIGLSLAACGGDGSSSAPSASDPGGDPSQVTVVAHDISFPEDTYRAEAGMVAIEYRNEGSIEHTLVIEDVEGFKLDVPANGDVDEGSVELQSGAYTIYCDIAGHRQGGMEATLEVG